jgi:hypothetical protein
MPPDDETLDACDAVGADDGSLFPVLASSLWQAVSERPAATARAAKVTL